LFKLQLKISSGNGFKKRDKETFVKTFTPVLALTGFQTTMQFSSPKLSSETSDSAFPILTLLTKVSLAVQF